MAETPRFEFEEVVALRSNVSNTPLATQYASVAAAFDAKSSPTEKLHHTISGIRTPHVDSLQRTSIINVNGRDLLVNSAMDKPTLSLIPSRTISADGMRLWTCEQLGAIEFPIITPRVIRQVGNYKNSRVAHTLYSSDCRLPSHLYANRSESSFINSTFEVAQQAAAEEDDINSDIRLACAKNQPMVPRILTIFAGQKRTRSVESEAKKAVSSLTILKATQVAAEALLNPLSPSSFSPVTVVYEESEMEKELAEREFLGGSLPNFNSSLPVNTGRSLPLKADSTPLPILAQGFQIETKFGLPTADRKYITFPVVGHKTLQGARPANRDSGAIMVSFFRVPIEAVMSAVLNATRHGILPLSMLRSINDSHFKGLFVSIDTSNLHAETEEEEEESEDEESSNEF